MMARGRRSIAAGLLLLSAYERRQLEQPARPGALALRLDVAAHPVEQADEAGVAAQRRKIGSRSREP
jgi:hypothetical protein